MGPNFTMFMTWEGLIRLSLSRKRPKNPISRHKGCRLLMIKPIKPLLCGSSSILKLSESAFFGTPWCDKDMVVYWFSCDKIMHIFRGNEWFMAQTTICILGFQFHFGLYGKDRKTVRQLWKTVRKKKQNCLSFLPPLRSQTPLPAPPSPPSSCRPSPCWCPCAPGWSWRGCSWSCPPWKIWIISSKKLVISTASSAAFSSAVMNFPTWEKSQVERIDHFLPNRKDQFGKWWKVENSKICATTHQLLIEKGVALPHRRLGEVGVGRCQHPLQHRVPFQPILLQCLFCQIFLHSWYDLLFPDLLFLTLCCRTFLQVSCLVSLK